MDDIIRCSGVGCPMKDECYRHMIAVGDRWYGVPQNIGNKCSNHMPLPQAKPSRAARPYQKVKNPGALPKDTKERED